MYFALRWKDIAISVERDELVGYAMSLKTSGRIRVVDGELNTVWEKK